jgi:hypothetical protein
VSIQLIPQAGGNGGRTTRESWAVMEARLRSAQAHGQLVRVVAQLDRLDGVDELPAPVSEALLVARRALAEGLVAIEVARRELDGASTTPPPPPV